MAGTSTAYAARQNGVAPVKSTPMRPAVELETMGYSIVIFPGALVRALAHAAAAYFESLRTHGSTLKHQANMLDFTELNELFGTAGILEAGKQYGQGGA